MTEALVCSRLDIGDPRWMDFIQQHPAALAFHHPTWAGLLEQCYSYRAFVLAACEPDGRVAAGIPFSAVESYLTGRRWVSLPFTDYCPVLSSSEQSLKVLTGHLLSLYQSRQSPEIEVRWELPSQVGIGRFSEFVRHELLLNGSPASVYKSFSKMHQRNIRKAEAGEVVVRRSISREDLPVFYRLHLLTRQRLGVPVQPWRFFKLLWAQVIEQGLGFVLLAYKDENPVAGALFLNYKDTVIYKYGASDEKYWALRPNNLLFWTAIRWACENGYRNFDFGNSETNNHGLREFKLGWGTRETSLFRSYLGSGAGRRTSGLKEKALSAVIRHSPALVCRVVGELMYRHYG